ncbi:MAG: DUF2293 domain-containing protein [Candidatus Eisenbacteria bacterium]|nr:DUF2293 domain-containing protein [Candidatus Eisenbacteria bacterium]
MMPSNMDSARSPTTHAEPARSGQIFQPELTVFMARGDSRCDECGTELGRGAWITLRGKDRGAACLSCADLDHLVFLPSGDAALTRRARKHSGLTAVVVQWSRTRKRYERQGLLVEEHALARAEGECEADAGARESRRARAADRRAELDDAYIGQFAAQIREIYPGCPAGRDREIARHACNKYSGRVGRSAAAKRLDDEAVHLAVIAHIRHHETSYDALLMRGHDQRDARDMIRDDVDKVIRQWSRVSRR